MNWPRSRITRTFLSDHRRIGNTLMDNVRKASDGILKMCPSKTDDDTRPGHVDLRTARKTHVSLYVEFCGIHTKGKCRSQMEKVDENPRRT